MPTLRLNDPALADDLLVELRSHGDILAEEIGPGSIRVSVLGSYSAEGMRVAIYLHVRAWEAAQRAKGIDVRVELD
ncbi:MAG TPA: hypothetical protein VLV46_05630 [Gaiellaceae bacterium]|jgi:hypothetical protein|nr:hypothetical protein [Gaiellaceae bacterium]